LQKRRELKVAGIDIYRPMKIRGLDYNAEVPFQKNVPVGRFAPSDKETPEIDKFRSNISLQQIE
jgi:hypothetical protein